MSLSTMEQLHVFHAQDREIFSKLVLKFSRSPAESLLVMATWFWLEDFGFGNIFSIIMASPDSLIKALANEAVFCFQCLESPNPPDDSRKIPLTARFMNSNISLHRIYIHRYTAIVGIKNFLITICSKIFTDILQRVLPSSSSSSPSFITTIRRPLKIPGFPHPTFGNIIVMPEFVDRNNLFMFPNGIWEWNSISIATEQDRTMFITFSRGFPVFQMEVKELFTQEFGENCVEAVYMQEDIEKLYRVNINKCKQQSLYGRMIVDSVATVDRILEGEDVRKLMIRGKHIWARKYENRDRPY